MDKPRLTDEQVIKALECCNQEDGCYECPYEFTCYDDKYKSILSKDALDLINRLKAENEKKSKAVVKAAQEVVDLKIELQAMRNAANSYKAEYEKLKGSKSTSLEKLPHNSLCETETYEG